jgi:hypothetical protein
VTFRFTKDTSWEHGSVSFEPSPPAVLSSFLLNFSFMVDIGEAAYSVPDDMLREVSRRPFLQSLQNRGFLIPLNANCNRFNP